MKTTIRRARMADTPQLAELRLRTWREAYAGILPDSVLVSMTDARQRVRFAHMIDAGSPELAVYCAEVEGALVGFGICGKSRGGPDGFDGEVQELYVASDWYGLGIGRALMVAMAKWLGDAGYGSVFAAVLQNNHGAKSFYRRLGGTLCGESVTQLGGEKLTQIAFGWHDVYLLSGGRSQLSPVSRRRDDQP